MSKIIPAIIPRDYKDMEEKLSLVRGLVDGVHVDIVDGKFVPSTGWPYTENVTFQEILCGEKELPFSNELKFSADLMIKNPEKNIEDWIGLGFQEIIIHFESCNCLREVIEVVKSAGLEIGIAINLDTDEKVLDDWIDQIDFVQLMGIKKIGYQGQEFDVKVINKVMNLRESYPELIINVDGGVDLNNAEKIFNAGADRLVSGSTIFKSKNIEETILKFENAFK